MRPTLLLFILTVSMLIDNGKTSRDYLAAFLLELPIRGVLNKLIETGNIVLIKDFFLEAPSFLDKIIVGKIGVQNLTLYGLSTLRYKDKIIVDKTEEYNATVRTTNVDINVTLERFGLYTGFEANFAKMPFNGKGEIRLEVKSVDVKVNVTLNNRRKLKIQSLDLDLSFKSSNESKITFGNNVKISNFLTKVLNIENRLIAMWFRGFKQCIECVISRIILFVGNLILNGGYIGYSRCSCTKKAGINLIQLLEDGVESWHTRNTSYVLEAIAIPKKIFANVLNPVKQIIKFPNYLRRILFE